MDAPEDSRIVWFIHDPVVGNDWSSTQLDTIQRLLPHIRHTVSVQQVLPNAAALGVTMGTMLEATGVGVLRLDARGRIMVATVSGIYSRSAMACWTGAVSCSPAPRTTTTTCRDFSTGHYRRSALWVPAARCW
ncbi:MAG: hypothetical protein OXH52_23040 [Gammaproteobacteria bacterium]|nr:hypothetical protein [Gammaproteobacteria bacterium]